MGNDYGDEDDMGDFGEEQEQHQAPRQQMSNRKSSKQDSKGRMADVQAAEDRLAALDLQLDSADNDLLLDDDPFAADAEPKGRRRQQQRNDDYGEEDDDRLDFEEDDQPQRTQAQRGRTNRREDNDASTLTNLGAGLATLQKQRDQRTREY